MSAREVIVHTKWSGRVNVGPEAADRILSALSAAGLAVVPREPTEAMLRAAATLDWNAQTDPTWREIYAAMLDAARERTMAGEAG